MPPALTLYFFTPYQIPTFTFLPFSFAGLIEKNVANCLFRNPPHYNKFVYIISIILYLI